tara:strand:+ start:752 stop:2407 length:1656 start_codon:yes stop_codon:yes gene_type:complete
MYIFFKSLFSENLKHSLKNISFIRYIQLNFKIKFSLRKKLKKQLQFKRFPIEENKFLKKKVFIPLIETSHYQFYQVCLIGKALQLRGAEIKVLICDEFLSGCEVKSSRNLSKDPCLSCRINRQTTFPLFGLEYLKISDLFSDEEYLSIKNNALNIVNNFPESYEINGIEIINIINDSVTRYFYGEIPTKNSIKLQEVRLKYTITTLIGFEAAKKISELYDPDIVFGNMEVYADWAPYKKFFTKKGAKFSSISMTQFDFNSILMNQSELFESKQRYADWLEERSHAKLNHTEENKLNSFLSTRFQGKSQVFKKFNYFEKQTNLKEKLKLSEEKKNIFLFSNVFWDVGISDCGMTYPGVIEWVISTMKIIKENKNIHLYIKPHPSESFEIKTAGVLNAILDEFSSIPENITIIDPMMKILTYDLFEYIDVGLVFNGTIGLEMILNDIPVIACGKTPYSNLELVSEPINQEEYEEFLLDHKKTIKPNKDMVELFAYFYFIKTLIPWRLNENVYGDNFNGFKIDTLEDILPKADYFLDHICESILGSNNKNLDSW